MKNLFPMKIREERSIVVITSSPRTQNTTQNKTPVLGNAIPVSGVKQTGVVLILAILQDRPLLSHINGKLSPGPFE